MNAINDHLWQHLMTSLFHNYSNTRMKVYAKNSMDRFGDDLTELSHYNTWHLKIRFVWNVCQNSGEDLSIINSLALNSMKENMKKRKTIHWTNFTEESTIEYKLTISKRWNCFWRSVRILIMLLFRKWRLE